MAGAEQRPDQWCSVATRLGGGQWVTAGAFRCSGRQHLAWPSVGTICYCDTNGGSFARTRDSFYCHWRALFLTHLNKKTERAWIYDVLYLVSFLHAGMDEEDDQSATLDQVLNDTTRVGYFKGYLNSVAQAIK